MAQAITVLESGMDGAEEAAEEEEEVETTLALVTPQNRAPMNWQLTGKRLSVGHSSHSLNFYPLLTLTLLTPMTCFRTLP
jgi:hypothetical protein